MIDSYKILGVERLYNGHRTIIEVNIKFTCNNSEYNVFLNFEFDDKENLYLFKFNSLYSLKLINVLVKDNVLIIKNKECYLTESTLLRLF